MNAIKQKALVRTAALRAALRGVGPTAARSKISELLILFLIVMCGVLPIQLVQADPHAGMSKNVVIIGGTTVSDSCSGTDANKVINGGCLPVVGAVGEIGDFTFAGMTTVDVSAANLASYDTAVLNVASNDMDCDVDTLNTAQKQDLVNFVKGGKKLIIFDSECSTQNYSWLPFPFTTANPGAMGANGTLNILEENILSSKDPANPHYIDAAYLGGSTDAVGI